MPHTQNAIDDFDADDDDNDARTISIEIQIIAISIAQVKNDKRFIHNIKIHQ